MHQENVRNKRKVPEPNSNYPTNFYNRSINHQHTNSLPNDTVPLGPLQQNSFSGSINNLNIEQYGTPSKLYEQNFAQNSSANHLGNSTVNKEPYKNSPQKPLKSFHQNAISNSHHVKTYSLPVDMGPIKSAPLPEGWTSEVTPTGQVYYINHMTQTTTWDDPRKSFNAPIPLPAGWEEKKTPTGEVYYVNHTTQTTQWEDPRLEIQQTQQQENLLKQQASYRNSYKENHFTTSTSSLNSSISSSSSIQSLNVIGSYGSPNKFKQNNESAKTSNKDLIRNLQQNLDKVLAQKNSITKQLDELTSKETVLKSRMTQKDLNEIYDNLKYADGQQAKQLTDDTLDSTLIKNEPR